MEDTEFAMAMKESKARHASTRSSAHGQEERDIARALLASKEEAEKSSPFIKAHSTGLSEARTASLKEVETQRSIKTSICSGKNPMVEKNQGQKRYTTPYVKRINGRLCWIRRLAKKVD